MKLWQILIIIIIIDVPVGLTIAALIFHAVMGVWP